MLEPAKDATGESAAHFLLKIAGMFGRPKGIRTDGGSQYDNHLLDGFCELLGMQRHVTLAYRPEANGRVERVWSLQGGRQELEVHLSRPPN